MFVDWTLVRLQVWMVHVCNQSYFVRTMETASLRMLSPNTSMLSTGSTLRALKMAMVATGSTAEISEPKAKLREGGETK